VNCFGLRKERVQPGTATSGVKYWSDGTKVAGQQFGYAFDTIGNRTQTQTGGDASGNNQRTAT
jgi:hypothetical protein